MPDNIRVLNTALMMVMILGTAGCGPTITREQAQNEIVAYTREFIVQQEIGGTVNYVETSDQPWVGAPPAANIIVWAPPMESISSDSIDYLKSDQPIKVWWFADNKLSEARNKTEAIQHYKKSYMADPSSDIWAWGYYEFGILSLSGTTKAEVYIAASCGPLCGHGVIYTVHRNNYGKWEILNSKMVWIS